MQDLITDLLIFIAKKGFLAGLGLSLLIFSFFSDSLLIGGLMFVVGAVVLYDVLCNHE